MTAGSGELTAASVIGLIESGAYPRDVVATIARGFLPLDQGDLIAVLAFLASSEDAEIAELSRTSLADIPSRNVFAYASRDDLAPQELERLGRATADNNILEALIRNRAYSDAAVADLARRTASPAVQEVIVINQQRIIRAPEILDALLENPQLAPDARRRALETREEFFDKKARLKQIEELLEPDLIEAPVDAIADLLEKAALEDEQGAPPATLMPTDAERKDERMQAIWNRIQFMSVSEKVQLAFKGDRTVRMILVRERNRLVCSAVMRNPRMSETEVESIAGMRNVDDEVLRLISMRRDWMGKYPIVLTLCRNPKVPVGVVLPLINRLTLRDLKGLKDDKGVSQVVRESAKRFFLARQKNN
jgi:hypothetical protein